MRELLALGLTGGLLLGLVVFTHPSAAVAVTVDGPTRLTTTGTATFTATVTNRGADPASLQNVTLIVEGEGERLTATAGPDGTLRDVRLTGDGGTTRIDRERVRQTLRIDAPVGTPDDGGAGYTSVNAGYGNASETLRYRVTVATAAFEPGTYDVRVRVTTRDGQSSLSNTLTVRVEDATTAANTPPGPESATGVDGRDRVRVDSRR